ncbi:MAG: response regulator [Lachnospiraceae bacterium]|nr:response regulator [Lachnospiraceae bacterium]
MSTILIIEGDTDLAEDLQEALLENGYEVLMASTAKDAMNQLCGRQIDLCLLDTRLPDGSGYELCAKIRDFFPGFIILLTVYTKEEEVARDLQTGADDYIMKPFKLKELLEQIRKQLAQVKDCRNL